MFKLCSVIEHYKEFRFIFWYYKDLFPLQNGIRWVCGDHVVFLLP